MRTGRLVYQDIAIDFSTYVKPVLRDWIMVGLVEGTAAVEVCVLFNGQGFTIEIKFLEVTDLDGNGLNGGIGIEVQLPGG